jgi:hypothetical protein
MFVSQEERLIGIVSSPDVAKKSGELMVSKLENNA